MPGSELPFEVWQTLYLSKWRMLAVQVIFRQERAPQILMFVFTVPIVLHDMLC
jgi:hypothetical protein